MSASGAPEGYETLRGECSASLQFRLRGCACAKAVGLNKMCVGKREGAVPPTALPCSDVTGLWLCSAMSWGICELRSILENAKEMSKRNFAAGITCNRKEISVALAELLVFEKKRLRRNMLLGCAQGPDW